MRNPRVGDLLVTACCLYDYLNQAVTPQLADRVERCCYQGCYQTHLNPLIVPRGAHEVRLYFNDVATMVGPAVRLSERRSAACGLRFNKPGTWRSRMRVLLDECVPERLRSELNSHSVRIVAEMSWSGINNGRLLNLAATEFDCFLTVDRILQFQQSLDRRKGWSGHMDSWPRLT